MTKFRAKLVPRVTEHGATLILMEDLNSRTSKTSMTAISSKSNKSKGIFNNLDVSKIFSKVPYPYVKFNEKHDGDIYELI